MNFSFFIVDIILDLNSNITIAIRDLGENLFNKKICFSELINTIGYSEIERCFLIETNDEKLTKRIKENID